MSITTEEITTVAQRLRAEHNWRDATYTTSLNVLSGFYTWLGMDKNPCKRIPRKKGNALRNTRTFVPTPEQFQRFVTALVSETHVYGAVVVAASTGLRFSKVAGLRPGDLHEDGDGSWYVTTWDKNGELHAAPLYGQALEIVRARAKKPGTWLLPGPRDGQLRQKYVIARLKAACQASGLHYSGRDLDGFSFHTLRKYFATTLFNSGADIRTVQVCGNWKSISVVERYAKLSDQRKKAAFKTVAQFISGMWDPLESTCRHASLSIL